MNQRSRDVLFLLFCIVVWALSFPVIKLLLYHFNPISLSFFRFSVASLALIPFFIRFRKYMLFELKRSLWTFILFSALVVPIPDLSQNFGMRMMDPETAASVASILQPMSPIFVLILATIFLKERMTYTKAGGIALAFTGAILLSTDGFSNIRAGNIWGESLILLSGFSYALSGIIGKRIIDKPRKDEKIGALAIITWSYFIGSLMLAPFHITMGSAPKAMDFITISAFLFLSIFTLIPYFLWYVVLKRNEVSRQSAYVFLIPLFGVLFSALLMGESLRVSMILYGALIMLGVYVAQMRRD